MLLHSSFLSALNLSLPSVVCDYFCSYPMWPSKLESDQKTLKQPQSHNIFKYVNLGVCVCRGVLGPKSGPGRFGAEQPTTP